MTSWVGAVPRPKRVTSDESETTSEATATSPGEVVPTSRGKQSRRRRRPVFSSAALLRLFSPARRSFYTCTRTHTGTHAHYYFIHSFMPAVCCLALLNCACPAHKIDDVFVSPIDLCRGCCGWLPRLFPL